MNRSQPEIKNSNGRQSNPGGALPAVLAPSAGGRQCLSCGAPINARRRYCSIDCRQKLRWALDRRTGLLRALNTRYAAFYFTDHVVVLDILPYGVQELFSFSGRRTNGRKPVEDFNHLTNHLGNAWWNERHRTQRHYLATRMLLDEVADHGASSDRLRPLRVHTPSVNAQNLALLKLGRDDLETPQLHNAIKKAFRLKAKQCHPDYGGSAETFRKVRSAYETLLKWAESPSFTIRRGFVDKWFYEGDENRWIQPVPERFRRR